MKPLIDQNEEEIIAAIIDKRIEASIKLQGQAIGSLLDDEETSLVLTN